MHLLIVAAGSGSRMRADRNKLLLPLAGRAVLCWTLDAVMKANSIHWIGIVGQPSDKEEIMGLMVGAEKDIDWVNGGSTRQESVECGLSALPPDAEHVLIHDGARCMVEPELINRCAQAVLEGEAVIAATPVVDTIKCVGDSGLIKNTPVRSELWAAQTPQGFEVGQLKKAHAHAQAHGWEVTDDASLYERLGWPVKVMEAAPSNIKLTTPFDLIVAEAVLAFRNSG